MMDSFFLTIFPPGSLANSVTTTVWIGVCVTCFFNLRLGWVLSGLVVPGYLVPLLIIKPLSATVIIFEAMITYFLVWVYSEYFSRYRLWNGFFGRDRFFALLIVSVLVRLIFDTLILPVSAEYITGRLGIAFDYRNNLHSFGLIVVALLANQFWKPGLRRGLFPGAVIIFSTYLIVRYGLIEFTNFNMGNIVYMYEDIASSMLSSPKAYIILLTTSVVASRMNLHYGWDYSGILIPSLLALEWYQPVKLVYTFAETFVILISASIILRLPFFRDANVEGARKTLLFFNIGFFYKLLLGWCLIRFFPEQKVTDYYGFGYLLTTLLAIKMHDKDIAVRVTRAALQTSFVAVLMASGIGFVLTFMPNVMALKAQSLQRVSFPDKKIGKTSLMDILKQDNVALFTSLKKNSYIVPLPREKEIFIEALKAVEDYMTHGEKRYFQNAQKLLGLINYGLVRVETHYLYLYENEPRRGWGSYVFNLNHKNNLLIQVPAPLDEWGSLEAGAWIFVSLDSRAVAFGGSGLKTNDDGSSNILLNHSSMFSIFQRLFSHADILQVRTHTAKTIRVLTGQRDVPAFGDKPLVDSILWVKSSLPPGLDLAFLKQNINGFHIQWGKSPFDNLLRDSARFGFAELMLNRQDARNVKMLKVPFAGVDLPFKPMEQSIVGYLQDWLLRGKEQIAPKGSDLYKVPKPEELLFFDHEILTPLLKISREFYSQKGWRPEALKELKALNASASIMGYEVIRYYHKTSEQDYLILSEGEKLPVKRYWGRYIFRLGPSSPYLVQTPRPLSETNVFEYSVALFERIKARGLMISTVHPLANSNGSSDLIKMQNKESLYTLVNQVVARESGKEPLMIIQCRGLGFNPDAPLPETDLLLSFRSGVKLFDQNTPLKNHLIASLKDDGFRIKLVDGSQATAGYEVGGIPQALYLDHSQNKEFTIIWLSPGIRSYYRQQTRNAIHAKQFLEIGIETVEMDIHSAVNMGKKGNFRLSGLYKDNVQAYIETNDIILFDYIMQQWPEFSYKRIIDLNSKQSFLFIYVKSDELVAAVNLVPRKINTRMSIKSYPANQKQLSDYVEKRIAWLEWEKE